MLKIITWGMIMGIFKKILKGDSGFSMVQVLMAAGLAGVVSLMVAKITQNSRQAVKTTEIQTEINTTVNLIQQTLKDEVNCSITFTNSGMGTTAAVPVTGAGTNITRIAKCRNTVEIDDPSITPPSPLPAGYMHPQIRVCDTSPSLAANSIHVVDVNDANFITRTRNLYALTMRYIPVDAGNGTLQLTFTKPDVGSDKKNSFGGGRIIRRIPISVEAQAGNILRCVNDQTNMINSAVTRTCQGMAARLVNLGTLANPVWACDIDVAHQVDPARTCNANEYVDGFQIDADGFLIPICVPMAQKIMGCSGNDRYVVFSNNQIHCRPLPNCAAKGQIMEKDSNGFFYCKNVTVNCAANQIPRVKNNSGEIECFSCTPGEVVATNSAGVPRCVPSACGDSRTNANQEYLVGFDSNGNRMCRDLITSDNKNCKNGGNLKIQSDGSIKYECCPDCTSSEKSNYCADTMFVSSNSCKSFCEGTMSAVDGTPGPWKITGPCSTSNFMEVQERACTGARCGGDTSCSNSSGYSYQMTRVNECWLYNADHTFTECVADGGALKTYNGNWFCYFSVNSWTNHSCHSGYNHYQNLGSTWGSTCSASVGWPCSCSDSCSTGSHYWKNQGKESCRAHCDAGWGCPGNSNTCHARRHGLGCY
jgi:hypothetical protein